LRDGIDVSEFSSEDRGNAAQCIACADDAAQGSIPLNKMKLLQAWIELHREELVADRELAVGGEQPYKIEPLK
jgi:hypothetical protein